jgi:hypothetical protein
MIVTRTSRFTGKVSTMDLPITQEQLTRYDTGSEPVQMVFPHLSMSQREFLMTGATQAEWESMLGPDPDELDQH